MRVTGSAWGAVVPTGTRGSAEYTRPYVHILVYLLGYQVQVSGSHAGYSFRQFLGVDSSLVVHQVVGDALRDVVLVLVVQDLVVDLSLGPLQLLVGYPVRVL